VGHVQTCVTLRRAFLTTAQRSDEISLAITAFKIRHENGDEMDRVELSDIAFGMPSHKFRVEMARRTEGILTKKLQKVFVEEIAKLARTREEQQQVRAIFGKHFPHTRLIGPQSD
jgi:translation elongation factor EF-1beta